MKRSLAIGFFLVFLTVVQVGLSSADDTELFIVQNPPDGLIVFDLSGSMRWTPAGSTLYVEGIDCSIDGPFYATSASGHTTACGNLSQTDGPIYGDAQCGGPFYKTSGPGHTIDCRRLAIAKRAIFAVFDDNSDNKINIQDEKSLGIRAGYMRFYNCGNDTGTDYTVGCNTLIKPINTPYSEIWNTLSSESGGGGTALAHSLSEAAVYLNSTKLNDPAAACRQKFAILVTDGEDTISCSGTGIVNQPDDYKRRRETVARAKALKDAGYKVFVVGFGADMPHYLKNTLNWVALHGGTDNPRALNSGNLGGYNPFLVTACQNSTTASHNLGEGTHYYATSNDPGEAPLSGYAFLARDASELADALSVIMKYIQEASYSFTSPTIPLVRLIDKDVGYISSFIPSETPFWKGNVKAFQLNADGTFPVDSEGNPLYSNLIWDAFEELKKKPPGSRRIYTQLNGAMIPFVPEGLTNAELDVVSESERINLVNHIRGIDAFDINMNGNTTEIRTWKLGDIFHSNAVIVGSPSKFFEDIGFNGTGGFYETNKERTKVIIVGANDGMLHSFNAETGIEEWAFVPNSLLKTLKSMTSTHTYYVDASPKVADVWFYSGEADTTKTADEWRTVLIGGLRKGGKHYFALDITDTINPKVLWEFPSPGDSVTLAKVGQSWSEPAIGRVKVEVGGELHERWVAFVGGGFDYSNVAGRSFFVIDVKTGSILWEFSYENIAGEKKWMDKSFPSPPAVVDLNADGYVDKVYIGDLGGQIWVFNVSFDTVQKKSNSLWTGRRLFKAPASPTEKHPVYYPPSVTLDRYKVPWVYFGTGDREYPKDTSNPPEKFYAIRDDGDGNYPRTEADLSDVTATNTFKADSSKKGWFIQLAKSGTRMEKVLAKPAIYNRMVYFTTYTYTETSDLCSIAGEAKLYVVEYLSGGGALGVDDLADLIGTATERSIVIGKGVPSNPVITVDAFGKASVIIGTTSGQVFSQKAFSPTRNKELLYWRDVIR